MLDILSGIGVIIGILLWFISYKKERYKSLKVVGLVIFCAAIAVSIPDFIEGFKRGFMNGPRP